MHNPEFPAHERGASCGFRDGFSIQDAAGLCGGSVKYFTYSCSDFPANAPYQPDNQRTWTAYFGCCAPRGPGPGPGPGVLPPPGSRPGGPGPR
jgi:hypothetical protein